MLHWKKEEEEKYQAVGEMRHCCKVPFLPCTKNHTVADPKLFFLFVSITSSFSNTVSLSQKDVKTKVVVLLHYHIIFTTEINVWTEFLP